MVARLYVGKRSITETESVPIRRYNADRHALGRASHYNNYDRLVETQTAGCVTGLFEGPIIAPDSESYRLQGPCRDIRSGRHRRKVFSKSQLLQPSARVHALFLRKIPS
jgi:hypothetical protein